MMTNTLSTDDVDRIGSVDGLTGSGAYEVKTVKPKKEFGPCLPVLADGQPFKRYAVFAGWNEGGNYGWETLRGRFLTLDEAQDYERTHWFRLRTWSQIVDMITGQIITQGYR